MLAGATVIAAAGLAAGTATGGPATASTKTVTTVKAGTTVLAPQLESAPASSFTSKAPAGAPCVLPDGTGDLDFHCYTPQQIRSAYGVDGVAPLASGAANYGQGQTIVLVDSYGSPTAAADLKHFHDTFFPSMPAPKFQEIYPLGNPQGQDCNGNGSQHSGTCAAAGWTGEATLDIEWAYSIAPEANIILLATPPAETLGVQGLPNLFKAISSEVTALPAGTVFSISPPSPSSTAGTAPAAGRSTAARRRLPRGPPRWWRWPTRHARRRASPRSASSTRSCTAASARRPRTPTSCPCTSAAPRRRSPGPMSA